MGEFKGNFQFNLQAKSITFLGWKFRSIILVLVVFSYIFLQNFSNPLLFTLLLLFQRVVIFELQKQWIWQIQQKIEEK